MVANVLVLIHSKIIPLPLKIFLRLPKIEFGIKPKFTHLLLSYLLICCTPNPIGLRTGLQTYQTPRCLGGLGCVLPSASRLLVFHWLLQVTFHWWHHLWEASPNQLSKGAQISLVQYSLAFLALLKIWNCLGWLFALYHLSFHSGIKSASGQRP